MIHILLLVLILCVIGVLLLLYEILFANYSDSTRYIFNTNPSLFYVLTPLVFWISSLSFNYQNANGPLVKHLKNIFEHASNPGLFKKLMPISSLIIVVIGSLMATYAGGSLGSEVIVIYISTFALLYISSFLKLGFNVENLMYMGYMFGLTYAFHCPLAGIVLGLEKSILLGSNNLISNCLFSIIGSGFGYYFMNSDPIFDLEQLINYDYTFSNICHYLLLSLLCGIIAYVFFTTLLKLYPVMKRIYSYTGIMSVLFGIAVAYIINSSGPVSFGPGINAFN